MNIVAVEFEGTPHKKYFFNTNLNLLKDGIYDITADHRTTYNNRIKVKEIYFSNKRKDLRTITDAKLLVAPPKPQNQYKKIIVNKEKETICILWNDETKTIMRPQPGECFDIEKGIAMCFMKKMYNNRGCFNNVFRDIEVV